MGKSKDKKPGEDRKDRNQGKIGGKLPSKTMARPIATPLHVSRSDEPATSPQPSQNQYYEKLRDLRQRIGNWLGRGNRPFTIALVVFAAADVAVGWLQWDATRNQYTAMVKQLDLMHLDQRPWLSIDTPDIEEVKASKRIRCILRANNTGKTPAFMKNFLVTSYLKQTPLDGSEIVVPEINDIPSSEVLTVEPERIGITISPGGGFELGATAGGMLLTDSHLAAIQDGTMRLLLVVAIKYRDIRDVDHSSINCFIYAPSQHKLSSFGKYNRMD